MSTKAYNITLPQNLVTRLDKTAKDNYMTRSDFIRYAVVKELKEQEDGWETLIDFTKIDKNGVSTGDVLKALEALKSQK